MNKIILIGNLTKDPELTTTANGTSVCKFTLAVNRNYTDNEGNRKADYFNIVVWRGQGENCAKWLKKGSKVSIVGSVENRSYEDKEGVKRTATDIVANEVEFLNPKSDAESTKNKTVDEIARNEIEDDDLPF